MPSKTRNFFGRVVDGVLPGRQYNRTTGQYSNIGSGITGLAINQLAPGLGTLGARLWEARNGGQPMTPNREVAPQPPMGVNVPDANNGVQSQWGSIRGGLAGLANMGGGGYGPMAGGYQFGPPAPTVSGLPNVRTTYGVSLPNYGGGGQPNYGGQPTGGNQQPQGPQLTPQQQAEADRIANNNRYSGPATFASPNNRQSNGDMWGHLYES